MIAFLCCYRQAWLLNSILRQYEGIEDLTSLLLVAAKSCLVDPEALKSLSKNTSHTGGTALEDEGREGKTKRRSMRDQCIIIIIITIILIIIINTIAIIVIIIIVISIIMNIIIPLQDRHLRGALFRRWRPLILGICDCYRRPPLVKSGGFPVFRGAGASSSG